MSFISNIGKGYQDELIATALVLVVASGGAFMALNKFVVSGNQTSSTNQVLGLEDTNIEQAPTPIVTKSTNQEPLPTPTPNPTPSPSPTIAPTPTASPSASPMTNIVEIPYGVNQKFENSDYQIEFSNPRLVTAGGRVFRVAVVVRNKNHDSGFENRLFAKVVKDGKVIIQDAPMSLSEIRSVKSGEQLSFEASLSLIETTSLESIVFKPGDNLVETIYGLTPPI